jgi:hypothetical protein
MRRITITSASCCIPWIQRPSDLQSKILGGSLDTAAVFDHAAERLS